MPGNAAGMMPATGGVLSQSDCYTLALQAGLTPARAKVAAAVAMAESGGQPNKHNTTPPDDSYGLWQINLYGNLRSRVKTFGLKDSSDLYNPQTNAKAMARISASGSNFGAWSTYTDKSYEKFLTNTVSDQRGHAGWLTKIAEFGAVVVSPAAGVVGALGGPFQAAKTAEEAAVDAAKVLGRTTEWVSNPHNWIRVAFVVGGGAILVVGLVSMLERTKVGKLATQGALGVATDGASLAVGVAKTASAKRKAKKEPESEPETEKDESE